MTCSRENNPKSQASLKNIKFIDKKPLKIAVSYFLFYNVEILQRLNSAKGGVDCTTNTLICPKRVKEHLFCYIIKSVENRKLKAK